MSSQTLACSVRLVSLQHWYFWSRDMGHCSLCGMDSPTIAHVLCTYPATADLRDEYGLHDDLIQDFTACLDYPEVQHLPAVMQLPPPACHRSSPILGRPWEVWWDVSFQGADQAGLGVTLGRPGEPSPSTSDTPGICSCSGT